MRKLPENCSMYRAAKLNISDSPIRTAIMFYGKKYTFQEVFDTIDTLADNLAAAFSLGKGDVVTLCLPNSPAAVFAFYAANRLGAAVNLVHPFLPPEKLKESIRETKSKLAVVYDLYRCGSFDFGGILALAIPVTALLCFRIIKRNVRDEAELTIAYSSKDEA